MLLFLVHFNLSGWVLVALAVVAVWVWALAGRPSGDYDFTPPLRVVGAVIVTVALAIGVVAGHWLR